jgi:CO dehydrogenase/acetyl-CoA synthase beta subunit
MSEYERLTHRDEEGEALLEENVDKFQPCLSCSDEGVCSTCDLANVIDRLAEYEDSGKAAKYAREFLGKKLGESHE